MEITTFIAMASQESGTQNPKLSTGQQLAVLI
jgi:hypothetical protein